MQTSSTSHISYVCQELANRLRPARNADSTGSWHRNNQSNIKCEQVEGQDLLWICSHHHVHSQQVLHSLSYTSMDKRLQEADIRLLSFSHKDDGWLVQETFWCIRSGFFVLMVCRNVCMVWARQTVRKKHVRLSIEDLLTIIDTTCKYSVKIVLRQSTSSRVEWLG